MPDPKPPFDPKKSIDLKNRGGVWGLEPKTVTPPPVPTYEKQRTPRPETAQVVKPDTKIEKAEAIARLRETIVNAQIIIKEETEGVVARARKKRIEELRKKLGVEEPAEILALPGLPEDVRSLIDQDLRRLKKALEAWIKDKNEGMIGFTSTWIKLLESNPIKYFTEKRDREVTMLEYVSTKQGIEDREGNIRYYTKEIEKCQRVIDALATNLRK